MKNPGKPSAILQQHAIKTQQKKLSSGDSSGDLKDLLNPFDKAMMYFMEQMEQTIYDSLVYVSKNYPEIRLSQEQYLDIRQAASLLQVSVQTIRNYAKKGKLCEYAIMGLGIRFKKTEVLAVVVRVYS
jgi:excisionase family DNA binding protein